MKNYTRKRRKKKVLSASFIKILFLLLFLTAFYYLFRPLFQADITDPFVYCAKIGSMDKPDSLYQGQKNPDAIVLNLKKVLNLSEDIPADVLRAGIYWRCMDGNVYGCYTGANIPCWGKADRHKNPSDEMNNYCHENPGSDTVPASVTGHNTIYDWRCDNSVPVISKQIFQVDSRGFIPDFWYKL